ncbi:hypothetical protein [Pseudofrankia asymbiotica]|uniref:Uncharacterized protein n=1 Tax=Pseudofrankia asymbiotica TaxID=1834516 RepID=A0A1V2I6A6_9ACTN|nr:hypothetical protein [Pseudofrankia asymbiotica]ONH26252.1 hypothetical protein BL253_25355 [Pseudofrankia asymbiotica]
MKLPPAATGFGLQPLNAPTDLRDFLTVCHRAAQRTGGAMTSTHPAGVTPNFHTVAIDYPGHSVAVLRHATLPLVAFTRPQLTSDTALAFVDEPPLAAAIHETSELEVLAVDQLHLPLARADLTALTSAELSQIAYWKPETVGDLLFNFWD